MERPDLKRHKHVRFCGLYQLARSLQFRYGLQVTFTMGFGSVPLPSACSPACDRRWLHALTRMHSSRMRTARSLIISPYLIVSHTCPPPSSCMPPLHHACPLSPHMPPPLPCMPPFAMHAPLTMHTPLCHTCPPLGNHACPPLWTDRHL